MKYITQIKQLGFCKLESKLSKEQISKTLELIKKWENTVKPGGEIPRLNKDQPNIYNLTAKDKYFVDVLFSCPEVEEILKYFLNDKYYKQIPAEDPNYILRAFGARSSKEELPLHIDSFIPHGKTAIAMQVAFMLEDSTKESGCTIVVPGSHLSDEYATESKAELLEAKAGDILIWNGALWHGTTKNTSERTRWSMVATFSRWWVKQAFRITDSIHPEAYYSLTEQQKTIMGYRSLPAIDESVKVDIKEGY